ncbi:hypothetical protein SEVIR_9G391650v4 [Setaria viridis]
MKHQKPLLQHSKITTATLRGTYCNMEPSVGASFYCSGSLRRRASRGGDGARSDSRRPACPSSAEGEGTLPDLGRAPPVGVGESQGLAWISPGLGRGQAGHRQPCTHDAHTY